MNVSIEEGVCDTARIPQLFQELFTLQIVPEVVSYISNALVIQVSNEAELNRLLLISKLEIGNLSMTIIEWLHSGENDGGITNE